MSKAINSPTARLLRNSRLFSLPPPLPAAPIADSTAGQILRTSDTATLPYPTHQAISAPASSRSRGDWGLKRPLPDRAIPKNTPHIRIKAIDNLNHITDFESAADHTQTLAKWQDMNLPLSLPPNSRSHIVGSSSRSRRSAFSNDYDHTTLQPHGTEDTTFTAERALRERGRQSDSLARWKTQGPHLTSLTEEEFERYLLNLVRQHKSEFRKFLEAVKIDEKRKQVQASMRNDADDATFELELQHRSRLEENELDEWIKELRDTHESLNSELAHLIRDFFDLPAFPVPRQSMLPGSTLANEIVRTRNDAGPPSTHPSAGLSYLLTHAIAENHPKFGPQSERTPVEARVLRTKNANRSRDSKANVGLGGFVTSIMPGSVPGASRFKDSMARSVKDSLGELDLSLSGGNKVWLQPKSAYVDEAGRVRLEVGEASATSVDIKLGNDMPEQQQTFATDSGRTDDRSLGQSRYGFSLPDERLRQQRPRPFETRDDDSRSGLAQIEELARGQRES